MYVQYALIRKSTGAVIKRTGTLPAKSISEIKGLDPDLQWIDVVHGPYPDIQEDLEGMSYKEEVRNGKLYIDFLSFKIEEGRTKPIEVKMESK